MPAALAVAALVVVAAALPKSDRPQVPEVVGMGYERAAAELRRAGYAPRRGETLNPGGGRCAVHRQRPAPLTALSQGARVRLDLDCDFVRY